MVSPPFSTYLILLPLCLGAPVTDYGTNLTALRTIIAPAWVQEPSTRGTWKLLYSCIFTLVLCVYTALHLNVPHIDDSKLKRGLRTAKWVAIAIFGPEIVVYTAFEQWFLARQFLRELNEIARRSEDPKFKKWYNNEGCPFDMVYGQYVIMGGFAADVSDIHNVQKRVTLKARGVLFLARHGHFCRVQRSDINDKSKADAFAKGLVCVQVLWLVGQIIERKVAGYPLTLLEIHTLVHVVCALFMYGLWIRKPLNIQAPTVIGFGEDSDLLAWMVQLSQMPKRWAGHQIISRCSWPETLDTSLNQVDQHADDHEIYKHIVSLGDPAEPKIQWFSNETPEQIKLVQLEDGSFQGINDKTGKEERFDSQRLRELESLTYENENGIQIQTQFSWIFKDPDDKLHYYLTQKPYHKELIPKGEQSVCKLFIGQTLSSKLGIGYDRLFNPDSVSLSQKDVRRLKLVADFLDRIGHVRESDPPPWLHLTGTIATYDLPAFQDQDGSGSLVHRAKNIVGKVASSGLDGNYYLLLAFTLIPTAYGLVHVGAFGILFPSSIEKRLWMISCYYLIATAGAMGLFCIADTLVDDILRWRSRNPLRYRYSPRLFKGFHNTMRKCLRFIKLWMYQKKYFLKRWIDFLHLTEIFAWGFVAVPLGLVALPYLAARIFLVFESFLSLRHVPVGVYQNPPLNIMGNLPHL